MMNRPVKMTAIAVFAVLSLFSCKHNTDAGIDEAQFCAFISEQNFEATGPIINSFLETLPADNPVENLQLLNDWLNNIHCIEKSVILCNSCIETYPPQSELRIDFLLNGQSIPMTLDILMDDPLTYRAFHE
jgi:hypothetical protein